MSLETWKKEFYSEKPKKSFTKKQAIEHSLKKWKGLTEENIKKHNCSLNDEFLTENKGDDDYLRIDGGSCSLCVKYYIEKDFEFRESRCEKCPLFKSLGHKCDNIFNADAPYIIFTNENNPLPMIEALQKTLAENS